MSNEEYEGILHAGMLTSSKEDSRNVNRRMLMVIRHRPPGFVAKLVAILRKKYSSLANALEMGEWCSLLQRTTVASYMVSVVW